MSNPPNKRPVLTVGMMIAIVLIELAGIIAAIGMFIVTRQGRLSTIPLFVSTIVSALVPFIARARGRS